MRKDPPSAFKISDDHRMDMLANMIIDRVFEEKQLYMESLKNDPNSKKEFNSKDFLNFIKNRRKQISK